MKKTIVFFLVFLLCSCSSSRKWDVAHTEEINNPNDTSEYKAVSNRFYRGKDGKMYIKTQGLIQPPEEYGPDFYRVVPVADVTSYVDLSGYYAKDRFHVYRDRGTTDGRHIAVIEEADVKTFSVINYRLSRDKNHVFLTYKL